MFILPSPSFALLPVPPWNIQSTKTGSFAHSFLGAAPSALPGSAETGFLPRPRPSSAPRVTCPNSEISSSPSSGLPERTRKCPGARAGPSGRAVRAFVPPAAGLPRRRHSQYVSPRPPALPPLAHACHALPLVAKSWLPFGSRAGFGGKRFPLSRYTLEIPCIPPPSEGTFQGSGKTSGQPRGVGRARGTGWSLCGPNSGLQSVQGRVGVSHCPEKGWGLALVFLSCSLLSRAGGGALDMSPLK